MRSHTIASADDAIVEQPNGIRRDAYASSFLLPQNLLATLVFSGNPTNGQTLTLTINGSALVITFVNSIGTTAGNVLIGGTLAQTFANLLYFLRHPTFTNSNQVALTGSVIPKLYYVQLNANISATTLIFSTLNDAVNYAPLTSFVPTTTTGATIVSNTMALFVNPGIFTYNGVRLIYSGGVSPTITAPVSNPRIDLLCIDNAGTLTLVTGTEGASPSVPTYPSGKLTLCEIYNVVGETSIQDNDNQATGQGYIQADVRPFLGGGGYGSINGDLLPDLTNTRSIGSPTDQWLNVYAENIYQNGSPIAVAKFGGTGADGAVSVASGVTTVDLANAQYVVKNYTSVSITGTGSLKFINPHPNGTIILMKIQGNLTITSSAAAPLDASGCGAAGGAGGTTVTGSTANGAAGNPGTNIQDTVVHYGGASTTNGTVRGTAGLTYVATTLNLYTMNEWQLLSGRLLACGSGGGGAAGAGVNGGGAISPSSSVAGGAGGAGGGGLLIEVAGALNFTSTNGISVAGVAGGNGISISSSSGANAQASAGGGGGAGGFCILLYNTLTAYTGSINSAGGAGGAGGNASNVAGGTGGGGTTGGAAGPGAGGFGGAGGAAAAGAGAGGSNAGGNQAGGGGGGGAAIQYNITATNFGGGGGSGGGSIGGLVALNRYFS